MLVVATDTFLFSFLSAIDKFNYGLYTSLKVTGIWKKKCYVQFLGEPAMMYPHAFCGPEYLIGKESMHRPIPREKRPNGTVK